MAIEQGTRFFVVPHTHWDREWYVPFEDFQLRLASVVDEVIDVLESDPSFPCFTLDGQAIVLEDYLDARPENEGRLRALLESGRLEVGPSYVLPDELLVGAEPLVRNLLMGRAVCRRFGAEPAPVGYMPDSFGHPLQLPQILAGFGIDSFIFSRGLGDQIDEVGVVFRWRSPDGSEVRAFQQLPHYGNFVVRDGDDAQARTEEIEERFGPALRSAGVREVLLCDGEDHRRIRRELPALCAELEDRLPGTSFTIARLRDYVGAVEPTDLPAWTGELVDSRLQNVLRGVNSARLYLKRANEHAERRLLEVETLGALRTLHTGHRFPTSDFRLAWRQLLKCHPHDSICGCSCDEVHRDMLVRYEQLERTVSQLQRRALGGFDAQSATAGAVNLLPYRRRCLVELPGMEPATVELDGFSARPVELTPTAPRTDADPNDSAAIESDCIRVEAAPDGTLTMLDKATGRRFDGLHRLEDEPDVGDLYNFCPVDGAGTWRPASAAARVLRDGPLVHELEVRTAADTPSLTVTTIVRLIDGIRRVEFTTTIDNGAKDHRLRAVFPVGETSDVRAEGQFALVHRPLAPDPPQDRVVRTARPDAAHARRGRARTARDRDQGPPRIRSASHRRRRRAVRDAASLRRHDLAPRRRDRHPPGVRRPADPDPRRPVPWPPPIRVRARARRRRARRHRAAPRVAGLPLRVPRHPATRPLRPSGEHRRRRRVLVPEGRRGWRRADPPLLQSRDRAGAHRDRRRLQHLTRPSRRKRRGAGALELGPGEVATFRLRPRA